MAPETIEFRLKMTFPSEDEGKKSDVDSRRRRPKFIRKVECSVCGDIANDHIHYGAIACYSCKSCYLLQNVVTPQAVTVALLVLELEWA